MSSTTYGYPYQYGPTPPNSGTVISYLPRAGALPAPCPPAPCTTPVSTATPSCQPSCIPTDFNAIFSGGPFSGSNGNTGLSASMNGFGGNFSACLNSGSPADPSSLPAYAPYGTPTSTSPYGYAGIGNYSGYGSSSNVGYPNYSGQGYPGNGSPYGYGGMGNYAGYGNSSNVGYPTYSAQGYPINGSAYPPTGSSNAEGLLSSIVQNFPQLSKIGSTANQFGFEGVNRLLDPTRYAQYADQPQLVDIARNVGQDQSVVNLADWMYDGVNNDSTHDGSAVLKEYQAADGLLADRCNVNNAIQYLAVPSNFQSLAGSDGKLTLGDLNHFSDQWENYPVDASTPADIRQKVATAQQLKKGYAGDYGQLRYALLAASDTDHVTPLGLARLDQTVNQP